MSDPYEEARDAVVRKAGLLRDLLRDGSAADENVDDLEQELCDAVEALRGIPKPRTRRRR